MAHEARTFELGSHLPGARAMNPHRANTRWRCGYPQQLMGGTLGEHGFSMKFVVSARRSLRAAQKRDGIRMPGTGPEPTGGAMSEMADAKQALS